MVKTMLQIVMGKENFLKTRIVGSRTKRSCYGTPGMYEKNLRVRDSDLSRAACRRCGGGQPKATGRRRRSAIQRIAIALRRL